MYEKMKKELTNHANDFTLPSKLQSAAAAAAGLTKLNKYYELAWANQFYTIATGMHSISFMVKILTNISLALHPYYCTAWFGTIGKSDSDKKDQQKRAEGLLTHVAEAYYENAMASISSQTPAHKDSNSQTQTVGRSNSWLQNSCGFEPPILSSVPSNPQTSKELLHAEIKRYLVFKNGQADIEDPLGWWKVLFFASLLDLIH